MPLTRRDTPNGPVWVRPPFRPEDYSAPATALRLFERWRGDIESSEGILAMRDGPFGNYVEVGREIRDGKTWIVLLEASREFAVEVEAVSMGFGEVLTLPPHQAYELARARDPFRSHPVILGGSE